MNWAQTAWWLGRLEDVHGTGLNPGYNTINWNDVVHTQWAIIFCTLAACSAITLFYMAVKEYITNHKNALGEQARESRQLDARIFAGFVQIAALDKLLEKSKGTLISSAGSNVSQKTGFSPQLSNISTLQEVVVASQPLAEGEIRKTPSGSHVSESFGAGSRSSTDESPVATSELTGDFHQVALEAGSAFGT
jgi:hypothetical protein